MNKLKLWTGTFCGAGLLPKAPGTWGSFFILPFIFLLGWLLPYYGIVILLAATSLLSLWSTSASVEKFGEDPPQFVMDECAGQSVVFLFTVFHGFTLQSAALLITGFLFFRFFDIAKPLGINALQKLHGKFGILADDLLAGFYALICLEFTKITTAALF